MKEILKPACAYRASALQQARIKIADISYWWLSWKQSENRCLSKPFSVCVMCWMLHEFHSPTYRSWRQYIYKVNVVSRGHDTNGSGSSTDHLAIRVGVDVQSSWFAQTGATSLAKHIYVDDGIFIMLVMSCRQKGVWAAVLMGPFGQSYIFAIFISNLNLRYGRFTSKRFRSFWKSQSFWSNGQHCIDFILTEIITNLRNSFETIWQFLEL